MGQINVTELLVDPDFTDDIFLVTRVTKTNSLGENVLSECQLGTVGSVQPASGRAIARIPEALRVANMTSFWLRGEIPVGGPGKYVAQISFRGVRYNVVTVFDWTNWGAGWCEGLCVAEPPAP